MSLREKAMNRQYERAALRRKLTTAENRRGRKMWNGKRITEAARIDELARRLKNTEG